jgi:hypothetical protein
MQEADDFLVRVRGATSLCTSTTSTKQSATFESTALR